MTPIENVKKQQQPQRNFIRLKSQVRCVIGLPYKYVPFNRCNACNSLLLRVFSLLSTRRCSVVVIVVVKILSLPMCQKCFDAKISTWNWLNLALKSQQFGTRSLYRRFCFDSVSPSPRILFLFTWILVLFSSHCALNDGIVLFFECLEYVARFWSIKNSTWKDQRQNKMK